MPAGVGDGGGSLECAVALGCFGLLAARVGDGCSEIGSCCSSVSNESRLTTNAPPLTGVLYSPSSAGNWQVHLIVWEPDKNAQFFVPTLLHYTMSLLPQIAETVQFGPSIGSLGADFSIYIPGPVLSDYTFRISLRFLNPFIHISFAFLISSFKL